MTGYVIWPIMFGGFGLLFTAIELLRPARPLSYRAALKNDLPALAIYGLIFLPVSTARRRRPASRSECSGASRRVQMRGGEGRDD